MCSTYLKEKSNCDFSLYSLDDSVLSELRNNLVIVNALVSQAHLKSKPEFFILGGAALVFYNLTKRATLDIDTVNRIDDNIRNDVSMFISDQASNVVKLNPKYKDRLVPYMTELSDIRVYLISQEDLIITKLYSGRKKDIGDLLESDILTVNNINSVVEILNNEYPSDIAMRYTAYIKKLLKKKENLIYNE